MRKVLLLIPSYSSFFKPIKKAFQELGWETANIDYRRGDLSVRVIRFVPKIGGRDKASELIRSKIISKQKSFKPDLVLTVKGELLGRDLLEELRKRSKVANWFPDPMNYWELMKQITPWYDFFFHFDPLIIKELRNLGYKNVYYLPFAAEIGDGKSFDPKYNISFVGTYSEFREKYLSVLKDLGLNIWGDPRWFQSKLKDCNKGGRISQKEMKDIIKKSKINVNLIYDAPREGTNLRTFEVTGSGGFLLTESVKDLVNLFKVGQEVEAFRSSDELSEKAKKYLDSERDRIKISHAGYIRSVNDHNYKKRIGELIRIIYGNS